MLSLYLNVDQSNAANLNRGFETKVDSLFRECGEAQNWMARTNNGSRPNAKECGGSWRLHSKRKSAGCFQRFQKDFWWQRDLRVELPAGSRFSAQPWVRPLLEVIEEHDRLAVVLIDKQHARVLISDASGLQLQTEITSDVPNKHATTGTDHIWSQTQMDRDHTKHVLWHAKRVADELASIIDRVRPGRIVIGGPVEATSVFTATLPKRIQQMIIGTISSPVDASLERLADEVKAVQERAEQQDEAKIVDGMITAAMKGDRAVLGITETLDAIQEGRVYRMVVAHDFRAEGKECSGCHVLVSDTSDSVLFVKGSWRRFPI